jgi:hypothetical protein
VAGAFLACKGGSTPQEGSPSGPDARPGPIPSGGDRSTPLAAGAPADASAGAADHDAGATIADAAADAEKPDGAALVVRDAGVDARAPKVDRHEHRKGMPVLDNLTE